MPETSEDAPGIPDDPGGASRADALVAIARVALADAPPPLRDRAQVVVHVTRGVLAGDEPGAATLEEGPSLPRQTLLRLACDASLVTITEDASGAPLDVGRRTRAIPPAIRRALRSRDRGCRFPGCPQTRIVEAHHIRHWVARGRTALPNLIELCAFHHHLHHEGGFGITGTADNLRFTRPDGRVIEAEPLGPRGQTLVRSNARAGVMVDPGTIVSRWCGDRLNRGYVVSCIVESWEWRAAHVRTAAEAAAARDGPDG